MTEETQEQQQASRETFEKLSEIKTFPIEPQPISLPKESLPSGLVLSVMRRHKVTEEEAEELLEAFGA